MVDLISREYAIKRFCEDGTWLERQGVTTLSLVEAKQRAVDLLESFPSADRPKGERKSEELANMICDGICYYKEVTVDADGLDDLCEGCLIKKLIDGRPTGRWKEVYSETDYRNGWIEFSCECCEHQHGLESGEYGWSYGEPIPWKFCPLCGAKMEGGEE